MTILLVVAFLATVIVVFHDVLLIAFGGVLLAVLLNAIVDALRTRFSLRRWVALLLAIVVPGIGIALALFYGGTILARQYDALRTAVPVAFQEGLHNLQIGPLGAVLPTTASDLQSLIGSAMGLAQRATGLISSTLGLVISVGVILFVGVCIAAEPKLYRDGVVMLVPPARRPEAKALLDEVGRTLAAWLGARLVSMVAIAILAAIGLTVLQVPYAIALGVFAGALAFIPNIGAFVAGIPAVILALAISPQRAALVIAMYWLAHTLDDFLVIPIAERRIVHLPPALTMLVQIALGGVVGLLGIAFAAPLTATAIVAVRILWIDPLAEEPMKPINDGSTIARAENVGKGALRK